MSKESFRIVVLLVKSIPNVILRYMYIQYCKKKNEYLDQIFA